MQVINLTAEPNPRGNRIDLTWTNPAFSGGEGGVIILRRESAFPVLADVGTDRELARAYALKARAGEHFSDEGLQPQTIYYYVVIAVDAGMVQNELAFASAMATAAYRSGEQLYRRLPSIYQRHDTVLPPDAPTLDPGDLEKGQLRRLMELFGLPLDLLRSYAAGMRNFSDVNRIDGALLPLLAEWIGWQNDFTLPLDKQRNELKYGPHYYRTNGIAANVRATINRLTTWDLQIREFFHSVARSNDPEQLTLWEREWRSAAWQPATPVTLDVAYEGTPSLAPTGDGRLMLLYHARQRVPSSQAQPGGRSGDQWHLWYKILDQGRWTPSRRLSADGEINKYPAAILTAENNIWVFWSAFEEVSGLRIPRLKLAVMAAGRAAEPAHIKGTKQGPFAVSDGDSIQITIQESASSSMQRLVVFHPEDFLDISQATAGEIAAVLNRELPGVEVTVSDDNKLVLTSNAQGKNVQLTMAVSSGANTLGLSGSASGTDADNARLSGKLAGSAVLAGKRLVLRVDQGPDQSISFTTENTATTVAATISAATGSIVAEVDTATGTIILVSPSKGEQSCIVIDTDRSTAAADLGFGAPVPAAATPAADSEPAAVTDAGNNVWLFWSSRRSGGKWKIWYNRFDSAQRAWGTACRLTAGDVSDRQPAVLLDDGTLRVFWSRKKSNGRWNIFYRSTAELDLNNHPGAAAETGDAVWTDVTELAPVPADFDRKDPRAVLRNGQVDLYYSTNQTAGWKIFTTTIAPAPSGVEQQITVGHFTHRAPAVFEGADGTARLIFGSNETQKYTSQLYPTSITRDARYSGTTTVDTRNPARISLQNSIEDILHYTYDTGRADEDWYARNKIGIYLTPTTDDEKLIIRKQRQIQNVLRRFLPIQVRAVFIVQRSHEEFVYTYDDTTTDSQVRIGEQMVDTILGEVYPGVVDSARTIADFRWLRTWSSELTEPGALPDLTVSPPDLSARLPVKGVEEGE